CERERYFVVAPPRTNVKERIMTTESAPKHPLAAVFEQQLKTMEEHTRLMHAQMQAQTQALLSAMGAGLVAVPTPSPDSLRSSTSPASGRGGPNAHRSPEISAQAIAQHQPRPLAGEVAERSDAGEGGGATSQTAPDRTRISRTVIDLVAKVSAFPAASIKPE